MVTLHSHTTLHSSERVKYIEALQMHEIFDEKKICKTFVPDKIMVFDVNDRECFLFLLLF